MFDAASRFIHSMLCFLGGTTVPDSVAFQMRVIASLGADYCSPCCCRPTHTSVCRFACCDDIFRVREICVPAAASQLGIVCCAAASAGYPTLRLLFEADRFFVCFGVSGRCIRGTVAWGGSAYCGELWTLWSGCYSWLLHGNNAPVELRL